MRGGGLLGEFLGRAIFSDDALKSSEIAHQ